LQEVLGYMENFKVDGVVTLDVGKAIKEFPTKTCSSDDGKAGKARPSRTKRGLPQQTQCFFQQQAPWRFLANAMYAGSSLVLGIFFFRVLLPSAGAGANPDSKTYQRPATEWLGRAPPLMVLGAEDDQIVDRLGVEETAAFYNVQPVWVKQAHDVMLGSAWQEPANALGDWLDEKL
jgi:hypothetical protein